MNVSPAQERHPWIPDHVRFRNVRYSEQSIGANAFKGDNADAALARLRPDTRVMLEKLDFKAVTQRQLQALSIQLFWDGEIDMSTLGILDITGERSGLDTPVNLIDELDEALFDFQNDTSGSDWSNGIKIYKTAMHLALGLRDLAALLGGDRSVDTYA